jgi:aspartate kinase
MTQIGAISFTALYDDRDEKLQQLASYAEETFDVQLRKNLTMLTVRHYNMETVNKLLQGKTTVLTQQTTETIQVIYDV